MQKYNKLWVALAGAIGTALVTFGAVGPEGGEQLTTTLTAFGSAVLVWLVPNQ